MYFVYVLWSNKLKKRYIGSSEDALDRLNKHNSGLSTFTKRGIPWILFHKDVFRTKSEALKREKFFKSGVGRAWLDNQYPHYSRRSI